MLEVAGIEYALQETMTTTPLVDIVMPTYNHEKFLVQAIESVLTQKTDFEYRLNIADDCSTDGTQAIIKHYAEKHADRITAILSPHNIGILHKDRLSIKMLKLCTARYVALLEGDDYWTDPYKLQKQVDFLDRHPDFAISCHNVTVIYDDGSKEPANFLPPNQPPVRSLDDLILDNFIQTNSVVFRRSLFGEFPDWFYELKLGDWPIHIMNAQHGKIGYIDEVMAAYRVHDKGFWTSMDHSVKLFEIIKMLEYVDVYLEHKYRKQVRAAKAKWYNEILRACYNQGELNVDRHHLGKLFWYCGAQERRGLISLLLRRHAPIIYKSLRALKVLARSITTT
jgi:glycosyltransferase involved in cell wall biosynthesis